MNRADDSGRNDGSHPVPIRRVDLNGDLSDAGPVPATRSGGARPPISQSAPGRPRNSHPSASPSVLRAAGWFGIVMLALVLILITFKPGIVLGLIRPAAGGSAGGGAAASSTRPTAAASAQPTAAASVQPTAVPSAAPKAGVTAPGIPDIGGAANEPALSEPTALPDDSLYALEGPSGLTPLAECCGGPPAAPPLTLQKSIQLAKIVNGKQQATITLDSYGYSPRILVVQKGVETTLNFDLKKANSCNDKIWFSLLDREISLAAGEKVPAFKPGEDFSFSCWMSMQSVYVKVVKDLSKVDVKLVEREVINTLNEATVDCH